MPLKVLDGNIFTSKCQTLVNTVNCVGVMGAGIALECRLRWPEMYRQYVILCQEKKIHIGELWLFHGADRWILNFPTKTHWKAPAREEYLHAGLQVFMTTYKARGIHSIAFPLLGAQNGGLDQELSQRIMESYLELCTIHVEIYRYDPVAPDDLFDEFKDSLAGQSLKEVQRLTGLRPQHAIKVMRALEDPAVRQLGRLATLEGIGAMTIEKAFRFMRYRKEKRPKFPVQQTLDI